MPAFMTIGKLNESDEVEPGDIRGDTTASWHEGWMMITSFDVDMKDDRRAGVWEGQQESSASRRDRRKAQDENTADAGAKKEEGEKQQNTFKVSKPTDSASVKILEWAKTPVQQDIQIDCCTTEEDWPFLTLIFVGVVPTNVDIEGEPTDSLVFSWKRAVMYTYAFDESNEPYAVDYAEFGEPEASAVTTTMAQRGLADYSPPPPDPHTGSGHGFTTSAPALHQALHGSLPPVAAENRNYDQERRRLVLEPIGELEFDLESFSGEEHVSQLYAWHLELRSAELEIEPKDVVGQEIHFRIEDAEGKEDGDERDPRFFNGVISSFLAGEMASDRRRRYHATVVPGAWFLTQRSDSRVFQEKSVKDVVEQVFKDAEYSDYDLQGVTKTHPPLPYCVQYQETDYAFVARLLEEAGIFYFFKQEEDKHTMVLCDSSTGYTTCPEDPLRFAQDVYRDPRVTSWRRNHSFVPGKMTTRDYNFETPKEPLEGTASTKIDLTNIAKAEVFEYPGRYADTDQGTTVTELRQQEREVEHDFVHAVSCYDSLTVGATFALENPPGTEEGGEASEERWFITALHHRAEQRPEYGLSIISYRNLFTAIPEEVPFTPLRVTPKPRILGPQTAVVVGDKETDEDLVDTDKYGRVKVQFHWDRKGKKDKDSSCWMRCLQSGAGAGSGSMLIPRIGWEVVVGFLDGDPDRPIVLGSLCNELHMPYHELPAAKHKTVLMTRSFPGGGKETFNELTFHDEKDKEEIYFHAERDFKRIVEHEDVLEVGEKEDGGQTIKIVGDQALTITKGNRAATLDSGSDALTVTSGDVKIDASAGKIEISAGTSIELKVGGSSVKIEAAGITMKVGGSEVKVESAGVSMKGMTIKAEGSISTDIKGMMTSVSGDGMLQTKGGVTMMQ
jgi:type VI secretion system secreted protein VgrG